MTAQELKLLFESELKDLYSKEEICSMFDYVLSEITGTVKLGILSQHSLKLDSKTEQQVYSVLNKLKQYIPVQYIFGKAHFYGMELEVNPNVLIPRPETEELVDWIIKDIRTFSIQHSTFNILDIGTGSGCIALALKKNLPESSITAIDISNEALETAKKNAASLGLDVEFMQADAMNLPESMKDAIFDIIVANPPYIKVSDKKFVSKNVLNFEPHLALFVPDENPLVFFESIAKYAKKIKAAALYFEIQENEGNAMVAFLNKLGFTDIKVRKDLSGKERMVKCR